jgi:4-alpha-glucanotransferase
VYPTDEILSALYTSRHKDKQAILNTLQGHDSVNDEVGCDVHNVAMSKALNFGMQLHLAGGSSALLSLQLEDWLEMDKPVNIPGTFNEYPNWRRKLSRSLQDIFNDSSLNDLAANLTEVRQHSSK